MTDSRITTIKDGNVVDDGKTFSTPELNVAAYLHFRKKRVISASKDSVTGKFQMMFSDPKVEDGKSCSELEIEFLNSDYIAFDNSMKTIKKMIYSKSR